MACLFVVTGLAIAAERANSPADSKRENAIADERAATTAPSQGTPPSLTTSPSQGATADAATSNANPVDPATAPVVRGLFNDANGWSTGAHIRFGVTWLGFPDSRCETHTYTLRGKTRGAFGSDCRGWGGRAFYTFIVSFKNISDRTIYVDRGNLVLVARDSRTLYPINLRPIAQQPSAFMPASLRLAPRRGWSGFVTFDEMPALVPASLSYFDGNQELRQVFAGQYAVVNRAG